MNNMSPDSRPPTYNNMGGWSEGTGRVARDTTSPELSKLAETLSKTKADYGEAFEALHLPTYARYIEPLADFLNRNTPRNDNMRTPTLWFQLIPRSGDQPKHTVLDVDNDQIALVLID